MGLDGGGGAVPRGWGAGAVHCVICSPCLAPQDAASPDAQQPPAAPPKPWSTFKVMTLGALPSAHRDRLELRCADWEGPCAGLDAADGDFQTEV